MTRTCFEEGGIVLESWETFEFGDWITSSFSAWTTTEEDDDVDIVLEQDHYPEAILNCGRGWSGNLGGNFDNFACFRGQLWMGAKKSLQAINA